MATQASSARGRLAETPNLANQPAWVAYLPATDRVTAAFGVEDNGGSAVRQEAAFAVLCDFIEALTSTSSSTVAAMPTGAQLFWYRYNASQRGVAPTPPNAQTGPLSSDANTLFMDSGFRSEVLAAFFPPFLQVMYLATPNAQRASEHVDGSTQPKTQVPIKKWLGADVSAAKAKGVDLTVFGIPVGGHWEVPDCPAQDSATGPTCRIGAVTPIAVKRGSMARAMDSMLAHPLSRSSAPWVTHHVLLAPDRRTEWVSDTLAVVVLDEQILGVSAQVSGSADIQAVETQLREKYHAAPKVIANSECSTQPGVAPAASTHDREWSLPGLHVYYRPVAKGFGCAAGHITVESDALHRLREQTVRDHEAHRPKM